MKKTIKSKSISKTTSLNCWNILIVWETYDPRYTEVIIYYKNDDNKGNKEVNDIYLSMGYRRKELKPYNEFRELHEAFIPYKRRGVYVLEHNKDDIEAEKDRWAEIRKAQVLFGND